MEARKEEEYLEDAASVHAPFAHALFGIEGRWVGASSGWGGGREHAGDEQMAWGA